MSLQSFLFPVFLAAVAGINFLLPRKYRYIWLCAASFFFYLSGDMHYAVGLFFCMAATYVTGLLLGREGGAGSDALLPEREESAGRNVLLPEREESAGRNVLLPEREESAGRDALLPEREESAGRDALLLGREGNAGRDGQLPEREGGAGRKVLLAVCVGVHILALALFRYLWAGSVFVPLGMSFYALQALGYVVEVYRGNIRPEKNFLRYAVYVSFFPTVMSGPIQRAPRLLAQIREGRDFDYGRAHSGLYLLLWGYLLKYLLANPLGAMVDFAYESYADLPGATLLWATVLYALQLYCDFAGYSSLAVGAAKVLGFDIDRNFAQPYFAVSVRDFWKRWHISLSSWLRDYVYIPLGGNRRGKGRKRLNLMATFLVSGLWHGAGLQYLVWGGIHGLYQVLEDCASSKPQRGGKTPKGWSVRRILRSIVTFVLVDFAWLFFRADSLSQALAILKRICFNFRFQEMTYYGSYLLGETKWGLLLLTAEILLLFLVDFLHERKILMERLAARVPTGIRWTAYVLLTLCVLLAGVRGYGQTASTFIYTRF